MNLMANANYQGDLLPSIAAFIVISTNVIGNNEDKRKWLLHYGATNMYHNFLPEQPVLRLLIHGCSSAS